REGGKGIRLASARRVRRWNLDENGLIDGEGMVIDKRLDGSEATAIIGAVGIGPGADNGDEHGDSENCHVRQMISALLCHCLHCPSEGLPQRPFYRGDCMDCSL